MARSKIRSPQAAFLIGQTSFCFPFRNFLNGQFTAGIYPKARLCWKGYDFDILNELTDEGLVNAGGRSKSASFNAEGEAKALELLKAYGIKIDMPE